jgi:O-antigen/teichoic acid export membrane protein
MDWNFIKGSTVLSAGTVFSRVLGMAFSLVLARVFIPEEYGAIRYAITLGTMFAVGTQPFGQHVLARFIGKYKHDADKLQSILPNAWIILITLFVLTLLVAVPVLFIVGQFNVGILAIIVGLSFYYAYWGLSRGFDAPNRLVGVSIGSNVVQLGMIVFLIFVMDIDSPLVAMIVFGLSYLVPIAFFQIFRPFPLNLDFSLIRRDVTGEILRFSGSIWGSHIGYLLYNSVVVILLERFVGTAAVGIYVLANTLARMFLFVPQAMGTLLMPRIAASSGQSHAQILKKLLALSLLVNIMVFVVYLLVVELFVGRAFGLEYLEGGIAPYIIMALAMITLGIHSVITAVLVGKGKAGIETISRLVALSITVTIGWLLIPGYGPTGAAIAMLGGALGAVSYYAIILLLPKLRKQPSSQIAG